MTQHLPSTFFCKTGKSLASMSRLIFQAAFIDFECLGFAFSMQLFWVRTGWMFPCVLCNGSQLNDCSVARLQRVRLQDMPTQHSPPPLSQVLFIAKSAKWDFVVFSYLTIPVHWCLFVWEERCTLRLFRMYLLSTRAWAWPMSRGPRLCFPAFGVWMAFGRSCSTCPLRTARSKPIIPDQTLNIWYVHAVSIDIMSVRRCLKGHLTGFGFDKTMQLWRRYGRRNFIFCKVYGPRGHPVF